MRRLRIQRGQLMYKVNEIFLTVQGEGHWSGRVAVFCRFSGCNLWNGIEVDRAAAICTFCDTTFVEYTEYNVEELVNQITQLWPGGGTPMVVFTGGEPMLQLDAALVWSLRLMDWYVAIETNGTKPIPFDVDWVCVSPKTPTLRVNSGDELKLVYPQARLLPIRFSQRKFDHFWLSPMDGPNLAENTQAAFRYCLAHPQWRLNTQTHKTIGVR